MTAATAPAVPPATTPAIINRMTTFTIQPATRPDAPAIHALVRELAVYEKLEHLMVSTPADFERELFDKSAVIECVVAKEDGQAVGFALFFHNFSTVLGRKGLYLEDLYVTRMSRQRLRQSVASPPRANRGRTQLRTLRMERPGLEHTVD